jgi:transposase, IS30 family
MCQKNYNIEKKQRKEFKYKHLNYTEKTQIERWYNIEHRKSSEIAKLLNKSVRTIQREIKRGLVKNLTTELIEIWVYSADVSEQKYRYNMTGKGPGIKLDKDYKLVEYIENEIKKEKKSPEILIAEIKRKPEEFSVIVCGKTIRNCIHKRILNLTEKDMIYKKEYKEKNKEKTHCSKVPAEKSIDFRPEEANDRSIYGHWEGDLVVGKEGKGAALLTFTERKTREEIIMKIPSKHSKNVAKGLDILEKKYGKEFKNKFKTITFDNGGEFRDYKALEKSYDGRKKEARVEIYYAHPYRSGERGSNENANRLIRRFIPKGTVITDISEEFIKEVENWINNLLRPMFGFKSSLEMVKLAS